MCLALADGSAGNIMKTGLGLRVVSLFGALLISVSATSSGISAIVETVSKVNLKHEQVPFYSRNPISHEPNPNASRDPQQSQWWTPEHLAQLAELGTNQEGGPEGPILAMAGKMFGLTTSWNQNEMGRGITGEALGPGGGSAGSQILGTPGGRGLGGVVNTNTGNKLSTLPIVSIPVKGNLALSFSMFHNSIGAENLDLGYGWRHNYDASLSVVGGGDVIVRMPDGLYVPYDYNSPNYDPPAGWFHHLTYNSGASQWFLTFKNQSKYVFDVNGRLYQIKDRYGNALTITRFTSLTAPSIGLVNKVRYVSAADGRKLVFGYDSSSPYKLLTITEDLGGAWTDRTWTFWYTSGDITSVTYPTNASLNNVREFTYNGNHDIITENDLENKTWTLTTPRRSLRSLAILMGKLWLTPTALARPDMLFPLVRPERITTPLAS